MKFKNLAVLLEVEEGGVYQVALDKDMVNVLANDLRDLYFKGGIIKVLPTDLSDIIQITNDKNEEE